MHKSLSMLMTIGLLVLTQGCGNSNSMPAGQATSQSGADSSDSTIAQVAGEFLEAIRTGNSAGASSRLTPLAQQVMRQEDMDFDLLANSTATFQVKKVNLIETDEAGVDSVWTELGADGKPQQEQWTLGLQRIEGVWRVRGIIADMGPNQQPVLMDFENPGQAVVPANTAGTTPAHNGVPQQALRPGTQDPFRQ
jgi:hypothetical protein